MNVNFIKSRCSFIFQVRCFQRCCSLSSTSTLRLVEPSFFSSTLSNLNEPSAILRLFLAHSSETSIPPTFFAQRERLRRQIPVLSQLSADSVALFLSAATRSSQTSDSQSATTIMLSLLYDPRFTAILKEALLHFQTNSNYNNGNVVVDNRSGNNDTSSSLLSTPLFSSFSFNALVSMAHDLSLIASFGREMTSGPSTTSPDTSISTTNVNTSTGKQTNLSLSLALCDELFIKIADASVQIINHLIHNMDNETIKSEVTVSILKLFRSFYRVRNRQTDVWTSGVEWLLKVEGPSTKSSLPSTLSMSAMAEAAFLLSQLNSITNDNRDTIGILFSGFINSLLQSILSSSVSSSDTHYPINETTVCHLLLSCLLSSTQIDVMVQYLSRVSILTDNGARRHQNGTSLSFSSLFSEWPIETVLEVSSSLSKCIQFQDKAMYSLSSTTQKSFPHRTPVTILLLTSLLEESKRRVELLESAPLASYGTQDHKEKVSSLDRMDPVSLRHAEQVKNGYVKLCFNVQHDRLAVLVQEFGTIMPFTPESLNKVNNMNVSSSESLDCNDELQDHASGPLKSLNDPFSPTSLTQPIDTTFPRILPPSFSYQKTRVTSTAEDEEPTPLLLLSLAQIAAPLAAVHHKFSNNISSTFLYHRARLSQVASDTLFVSGLLAVSHALLGISSAKVEMALLHTFLQAGVPHRALFSALARRVVARSSDFGGKRLKHLTLTELTNTLVAFVMAWEFDQDAFAILLREIDIKIKSRTPSSKVLVSPSVSKLLTLAAAPDFEWGRGRELDLNEANEASGFNDDHDDVIVQKLAFISYAVASLTPFSRFVKKYSSPLTTGMNEDEILRILNSQSRLEFTTLDPTLHFIFTSSSAQDQLRRAVVTSSTAIRSLGLDIQIWASGESFVTNKSLSFPLTIPLCIPSLKIAFEFVSPESTIAMPTVLRREIERLDQANAMKRSLLQRSSFTLGNFAEQRGEWAQKDNGDWARKTLLAANVVPSLQSMWRAAILTSNGWSVQFINPSEVDDMPMAENLFRNLLHPSIHN